VNSLILKTATNFLLALMLLFSVFILFRGHNEPGGGFIAGLITGSAFALYIMAHGPVKTRQLIRVDLRFLTGIGISFAAISGLISAFAHKPFLSGLWMSIKIGHTTVKVGTPLLFDVGVYLVVVAVILMIIFALEEI